jgi:NAD-dependent deacetylase
VDVSEIVQLIKESTNIILLTGAGMSSESGLPTFRGKDGYWVKEGKNYRPMELATYTAFQRMPETVWEWYHHRREVYSKAMPNKGHLAIVDLEKYCSKIGKEFLLVTQNVDNLHQKAGSSPSKMVEIHGNIFYMRCASECEAKIYSVTDNIKEGIPSCPKCGGSARPHVLWFDEYYDETYFNFQTVMKRSDEIDLLFIIGTTLQTTLPANIFRKAHQRGIPIIEINPFPLGLEEYGVKVLKGAVGEIFPLIIKQLNLK